MEGSVTSTNLTPRSFISLSHPMANWLQGDINRHGEGRFALTVTTGSQVIPLSIAPFPDGFQGNLNETWQQGLKLITGLVP
jgi:hypothetical protein